MEDNKSYFYSLFSEEESSSPEQYLLDLWDTNKQQVLNIIENAITHSKKYRGLSKCLCSVAIKIRDERLSSIIERKASSCIKSIESNSYYVVASILLGSKKIIAKFCKNFNGSFSNGFDHYDYNDFITSFYLEIIALAKCREAKQYVSDLLNMADTQISRQKYIRKHQRNNLQEKILIPDKILKKDCHAVKMGEAVFDYLNEGAEKLKMYLNSTGDRADRAYFYLWCLACNKNKNDIVCFVDHLNNTDNFHIKNMVHPVNA